MHWLWVIIIGFIAGAIAKLGFIGAIVGAVLILAIYRAVVGPPP